MNDTIYLGLIVAVGPIATIIVNRWAAAKDKKVQYARDDLLEERTRAVAAAAKADSNAARIVAEQAARAAQLLLEHDAEAASIAKSATEAVHAKLAELGQGQERIHVLVNSQLDASLSAQFTALKGWRASVKDVGGDIPLLKELDSRIAELQVILDARAEAAKIAKAAIEVLNVTVSSNMP